MSRKSTVVVPEVIEENRAVAAQNRDGIVKTIARQIEAVRGAELRSTFEKLKLGAMVKQAVTLLGLDSRGRGHEGEGVKGWWDENFKGENGQPVIPYRTLMMWIAAAENLSKQMAVGGGKSEAIMCTLAKNPEKVVGKEAKILKSAEKVANGMTMRQMLLWGDDDEACGKRRGRPKGTTADLTKKPDTTDKVAAARAAWSKVIVQANTTMVVLQSAVRLLSAEDVENAKIVLQSLMDLLNEREGELKM